MEVHVAVLLEGPDWCMAPLTKYAPPPGIDAPRLQRHVLSDSLKQIRQNFVLINKNSQLNYTIIIRQLYKHSYWLVFDELRSDNVYQTNIVLYCIIHQV